MTPSSAATTTTAMSVTFAPRARIAVNASWPGRVEEDDALAVVVDLARADVLGDAAALAGGDLGRADGVEQARLAVVDVAHHGHDRGPRQQERRRRPPRRGLPWWRARGPVLALAIRHAGPAAIVSATSYPSSPATSDAVSRSISWLIVAKMPLLMSSRITSAGLTDEELGELLHGDGVGSSIAPRSRGSVVFGPVLVCVPCRRGGLRGPRRPRVRSYSLPRAPPWDDVQCRGSRRQRIARSRRGPVSRGPGPRAPLLDARGSSSRRSDRRRRR